jgi:hypothetical protein
MYFLDLYSPTQVRFAEDFGKNAEAVKLPGREHPQANIPLLVQGWLSNEGSGKWILVLDSADNPEVRFMAWMMPAVIASHWRHTCRRVGTDSSSLQLAAETWLSDWPETARVYSS